MLGEAREGNRGHQKGPVREHHGWREGMQSRMLQKGIAKRANNLVIRGRARATARDWQRSRRGGGWCGRNGGEMDVPERRRNGNGQWATDSEWFLSADSMGVVLQR